MTESFAELFEQSEKLSKLKPGAIVLGGVVEVRSDVVVITASRPDNRCTRTRLDPSPTA